MVRCVALVADDVMERFSVLEQLFLVQSVKFSLLTPLEKKTIVSMSARQTQV